MEADRPYESVRWMEIARWTLPALLLVATLWHVPAVLHRLDVLDYPYPVDHEEDYLLVHAWRLANGEFYVQPLTGEGPFIVGTYMPAFPLAVSLFTDATSPSLAPGRTLAAFSALALALAVILLLALSHTSVLAAALLGTLFLLNRDTLKWLPLYRVDFSALLFGLLGLILILVATHRSGKEAAERSWLPRSPLLWLGGGCFLLAFFTKQTTLAAPLAATIWLARYRGLRPTLGWAGTLALGAGLLFLLFELISPGSFWFHTVIANANVMDFDQLRIWVVHFVRFNLWLILAAFVAAVSVAVEYWFQLGGRRPFDIGAARAELLATYAFFALLTFLGSAKLGAAENYMLEPFMALLLLIGLGWRVHDGGAWRMTGQLLLSALLAAHLWHLLVPVPLESGQGAPRLTWGVANPSLLDATTAERAEELVAAAPEETWCERASISLRHGSPLFLHPFICAQLDREGKWDAEPAVDVIRSGRFRRLIITEDIRPEAYAPGDAQYTPAMREAILQSYDLLATLPGHHFSFYIYERR